MRKLILASASPRRQELLQKAKVPHQSIAIGILEIDPHKPHGMTPAEFVWRNALLKARLAAKHHSRDYVLAADTIVALGSRTFGKPRDLKQAIDFLRTLSGRTHEVLTAVIIIRPHAKRPIGFVERSEVTFRRLSPARITRYLKEVNVLDKAGAYALQENGPLLISKVRGSRTNVIGLPVERLIPLLQGLDF